MKSHSALLRTVKILEHRERILAFVARPVSGRSSLDDRVALDLPSSVLKVRTRCAPGRRAPWLRLRGAGSPVVSDSIVPLSGCRCALGTRRASLINRATRVAPDT